jgi:hypothetical protein
MPPITLNKLTTTILLSTNIGNFNLKISQGYSTIVKNHTLKCMACQKVWFLSTSRIILAFSRTKVGSLHKNNSLSINYPISRGISFCSV